MDSKSVVIYRDRNVVYPRYAPFHPSYYPENNYFNNSTQDKNDVYEAVRSTFRIAGLDANNYGTEYWNPLGNLINPGETVLIKPNLIKETRPVYGNGWEIILTHGSLIRAVSDYIWKAMAYRGKVIVADAPQTDSSFDNIVKILGLDVLREFYLSKGLNFELIDLRLEEWRESDGVIVERKKLPGDPNGSILFDLADNSEFVGHKGSGNYYGSDYDAKMVNRHHKEDHKHQYLVAGSAIKADVVFNIPKLKTHKKAGITVSLKNLVGITADKNYLPHHTDGRISNGGDATPDLKLTHMTERIIAKNVRQMAKRIPLFGNWYHRQARNLGTRIFGNSEEVIRNGNWWGNDTIWRMCLDLNKILFYGRPDGTFKEANACERKRHFVLVDGIIAGEGSGPMNPTPVNMGTLFFGSSPASVDAACAYLMGFSPDKIPIVRQSFKCERFPLTEWDWTDIELISDDPDLSGSISKVSQYARHQFEPHFGWKEHIEDVSLDCLRK